jgi:hypothetical protein
MQEFHAAGCVESQEDKASLWHSESNTETEPLMFTISGRYLLKIGCIPIVGGIWIRLRLASDFTNAHVTGDCTEVNMINSL